MTRRLSTRDRALTAVQYGTTTPDGTITPHQDRDAALAAGGRVARTTARTPWVYDDTGIPVPTSAHTPREHPMRTAAALAFIAFVALTGAAVATRSVVLILAAVALGCAGAHLATRNPA